MRLRAGEVAGRDWRTMPLSDVVRVLVEDAAVSGRPLLVAIDGRGGAGKTVLAERLRSQVAPRC